jgi:hypothetical protein
MSMLITGAEMILAVDGKEITVARREPCVSRAAAVLGLGENGGRFPVL